MFSFKEYKEKITNEIDNEIDIEVRKAKKSDFKENEKEIEGSIYISLTCPESKSENIITKKEAETLCELLQKTLKDK